MKIFKMRRAAWALALMLLLTLAVCVLPAGAQDFCEHAEGYVNGFCIGCDAAQEAPLNEDVYEISNAGQLYWFAAQVRDRVDPSNTIKGKLMDNITVNADLLDASGQPRADSKRDWEPIGNSTTPAQNIMLDGQGYYISGLYAKYEDGRDVGFFGNTTGGVMVQNLGIIDSYFYSDNGFVGGIVGNAADYTQMQFCYVDATLESPVNHVGGIAGALDSTGVIPCGARYCYTTYSKFVHGATGDTAFTNCFYRAESETDAFAGTAYYKADLTLDDGTSLAEALALESTTWEKSCRTGLLALKVEHVYAYACTPECTVCDDTNRADQAPHTYDNDCDAGCNVCSRIRQVGEHQRYTTCGAVCRICGAEIGAKTLHQYSNECDKTCDCGFERDVVPHLYDDACDNKCNLCNEFREAVPHKYESACDRVCECGMTRPPVHTYDNVCDADCNVCGEKRTAGYVFGDYVVTKAATALRNGEQEHTCTVCGYKETQVIARLGVATWIIVLGGVGAGLVLSVGGFALYWFVIKKRTLAQFFGKEPKQKKDKE